MLETTKAKAKRMFSQESLKRLEDRGLMIIDKHDFDVTMEAYNQMKQESRTLKAQIKALEARIQQMQQKKLV